MCPSDTQRALGRLAVGAVVKAPSAVQAYREAISFVHVMGNETSPPDSKVSVGCNRKAFEVMNLSIMIEDPCDRLFPFSPRCLHLNYALGNFMWQIFGRDDLAFIQHYNEKGKNFSDNGQTLYGAYGPRLLGQLTFIEKELTDDPMSRRAVAHIHRPEDLGVQSRDIPCPLTTQFLIRNGHLHLIVSMRSQSIVMVLPYDIMLMTMVQEMMAAKLGYPVGMYIHNAASAHIYRDEEEFGRRIQETISIRARDREQMPPMMKDDFDRYVIHRAAEIEEQARKKMARGRTDLSSLFWNWVGNQLGW